jgi:hypothetical protein
MAAATAQQIAKYGHIAAAIREAMHARNISPSQLTAALGLRKQATTVYPWIAGTSSPVPKYRGKLIQVLGLTKEQVTPRELSNTSLPATAVMVRPRPAGDVLSFSINSNGMTRIKLDAELPLEAGSALLRMLLDAGIVYAKQEGV